MISEVLMHNPPSYLFYLLCHLVALGTMASVRVITAGLTDSPQVLWRTAPSLSCERWFGSWHCGNSYLRYILRWGRVFREQGIVKTFTKSALLWAKPTGLSWLVCSSQRSTWPLTPAHTSKCCHNCHNPAQTLALQSTLQLAWGQVY